MTIEAEILDQLTALLGRRTLSQQEYNNWLGGTSTGGPNGDGNYPLTDGANFTRLVACPAKLYLMIAGKYDTLFAAAGVTQDQIKAWLAGTANGGPFGEGLFPVTLSTGAVVNIPSPAKMQADHDSVATIVGIGSLIALTEGRVYAAKADLIATTAADDKWALVHSDSDLGANGYYLRTAGAWVMRVSLASEALLLALGVNLRALVVTQLIGRPTDPSKVASAVTGTNLFLWNTQVVADGRVTGLRIYAATTGTIRLQSYSVAGTTATKKRSTTVVVTAPGLQTLAVDLEVDAGDYVGIAATSILTATTSTAADGGGWYQFHPDPDTRPLGTVNTTTRLEAQFQLSTIQQTVNAQAFGVAVANIADLIGRVGKLEAQAALLWRSVTQQIGLPAGLAPVTGTGASDQMFIWVDPVAIDGTLTQLRFFAVAPGTVQLARYSRTGTQVTREAMVGITIGTTGAKVLTAAQFGDFPVKAGEHLALAGAGVFTSVSGTADGAGWWQVNAGVPVRTVGAAATSPRLQVGFSIDQPIQFVTADRVKTIEDQGADHETRIDALEPQVAALSSPVVQTVGRTDAPVVGAGVSSSMFIWNAPIDYDGTLSLVTINVLATGTFTLVRWKRDAVDPAIIRRQDVRTLTATATGVQTWTPAQFGGPMDLEAGELLGLSGTGRFGSTSGSADDGGWWQVNDNLDTRTLGALFTTNRLEASFRLDQYPQVVTAASFLSLQGDVEEIKSAGVGAAVSDGALVESPDWLWSGKGALKAPLIGGRTRMARSQRRVLAHIATIADVVGGSSISGLSDETTDEAAFGGSALRLVTTGAAQVTLAPVVAAAVPVNVTNGIVRIWLQPVANVFNGIDRFSIELHSAGTPSSPTGNYHRLDPTAAPYDFRQRLTSPNGEGRWQAYAVHANLFSAVGTGADLTQIKFARFIFRTASGQSATLRIGDIDFIPNGLTKAKAILSFDDAHVEHMTFFAAQMAKYGFPGVLFPSPVAMRVNVLPSYLSVQQIQYLHDILGWQIASQAWTTEDKTTVDGWTENQFTAELAKLRNWQKALGVTGGEHGSYFSGVSHQDMIAYPSFRKHFRSMRAYFAGGTTGSPMLYGETFPWGDPFAIRCLNGSYVTDSTNAERLQAHAQQAITQKGVAYYAWHIEPFPSGSLHDGFLALLNFLDANRDVIDVVTEEDLMNG